LMTLREQVASCQRKRRGWLKRTLSALKRFSMANGLKRLSIMVHISFRLWTY